MKVSAAFIASLIGLSVQLLLGCNYNEIKGDGTVPNEEVQSFNLPEEQQALLSFSYVYQNVFQSKCIFCHDKAEGVNLSTYESVVPHLAKVKETVFVIKTMPKQGSLSHEQKAILWTWLDMGAPKESVNKPPSDPSNPAAAELTATFDSISKLIFEVKCLSCHSAGKSARRILLDKSSILNSPLELVIPGNADESGLVLAIELDNNKRMPPAKDGFAKLSNPEITAIRTWINNGAVD